MSKETPPGVDEGKGMARQDVAVERRKEGGKSHKHGVFMLEMWTRVLNGIEDQAVILMSAAGGVLAQGVGCGRRSHGNVVQVPHP